MIQWDLIPTIILAMFIYGIIISFVKSTIKVIFGEYLLRFVGRK
jgi:ABC-type phosphate transport system permease subunit